MEECQKSRKLNVLEITSGFTVVLHQTNTKILHCFILLFPRMLVYVLNPVNMVNKTKY